MATDDTIDAADFAALQGRSGKRGKSSPTMRLTLDKLKADGWLAEVTEQWVRGANRKRDHLGFIDVLAYHPTEGTLAIQATTTAKQENRTRKIVQTCAHKAKTFLLAGCGHHAIEVWGWRMSSVDAQWHLTRTRIMLDELR